MRSSRSTHAILSLPHKYRVPQGRKRSLGYARDDDTRERAISHSLSFLHVEGCPCGAVYPPPSARPFFKGLHNSHVKTLNLRKVSSPHIVISIYRAETCRNAEPPRASGKNRPDAARSITSQRVRMPQRKPYRPTDYRPQCRHRAVCRAAAEAWVLCTAGAPAHGARRNITHPLLIDSGHTGR